MEPPEGLDPNEWISPAKFSKFYRIDPNEFRRLLTFAPLGQRVSKPGSDNYLVRWCDAAPALTLLLQPEHARVVLAPPPAPPKFDLVPSDYENLPTITSYLQKRKGGSFERWRFKWEGKLYLIPKEHCETKGSRIDYLAHFIKRNSTYSIGTATPTEAETLSLYDLKDKFIEQLKITTKKPTSLKVFLRSLDVFLRFPIARQPVSKIRSMDVELFANQLTKYKHERELPLPGK